MTGRELKKLEQRWNTLTDKQRWKAIIAEPETFKDLVIQLDNDETFLIVKEKLQTSEFKENFYLQFDEFIGWSDGVQILLDAININAEPV